MDRREFIKAVVASSFISPFFLNQKIDYLHHELYLISADLRNDLPPLLTELRQLNFFPGRKFAFFGFHPSQADLTSVLTEAGLIPATEKKAEIKIKFVHLLNPASPSFTLIQEGRIRDLRSAKLYSLWKKMQAGPTTTALTIFSLSPPMVKPQLGNNIALRVEGKVIERLPLNQSISRVIDTGFGRVAFRVENGQAWVEKSTCRQRVCLASSPIKYVNERIICAPNHFLIEVEGRTWLDAVIG
ncbi:MAG: NusG domain II-containing protein [Candidatus Aminicenantes bacterium]|nr:NusG domain II-containing protein [Candidatus Aminicenantes bacterium]